MMTRRMTLQARSESVSVDRTPRGRGLVLMVALVSLGCGRQQDAATYPTSSEPALEVSHAKRISTAEEEADSYWSSTYGNPRPKLTETLSLGTSDLPTSAPPSAASNATDTTLPTSTNVAQASATAIVIVPGTARWKTLREYPTRAPRARKLDSSRGAKQAYSGATPKTPAPAPPGDSTDTSTKRTSIVAPALVRAVQE